MQIQPGRLDVFLSRVYGAINTSWLISSTWLASKDTMSYQIQITRSNIDYKVNQTTKGRNTHATQTSRPAQLPVSLPPLLHQETLDAQTMAGQHVAPSSAALHDRKWLRTQMLVHHLAACAPLPTGSWGLSEHPLIVSYCQFQYLVAKGGQ